MSKDCLKANSLYLFWRESGVGEMYIIFIVLVSKSDTVWCMELANASAMAMYASIMALGSGWAGWVF